MLRSAHWLGHLEYDWELPILQHFLLRLAKDHALVRYDARGNGLSDWDVHEISLDAWVSDMETVADAAGLDRFPLLGFRRLLRVSCVCRRHPERVSHLILYGGFAVGANKRPNVTAADRERFAAMKTLVKQGWGADNPAFRQIFTSLMSPPPLRTRRTPQRAATPEHVAECAVRYLETVADSTCANLIPGKGADARHARSRRTQVPSGSGARTGGGNTGCPLRGTAGEIMSSLEQDPGLPRFFEELKEFLKNAL